MGGERNYKERLRKALHNLFILLLREGISGEFSGDGTGYSLTVTKHYRSNPLSIIEKFLS